MKDLLTRRRVLFVVFGLALGARLITLVVTGKLFAPEVWEYEEMADNFLAGKGLICHSLGIVYYSFTGPLYPLFCATVYSFTNHSHLILALIQAVISALNPVATAAIGWDLFGPLAAISAGILGAFHPGYLIYTTKLHALILDSLLFSLIAWGSLRLIQCSSVLTRIWIGIVWGLSILSRPTILLFFPLFALWFWRAEIGTKRQRTKTLFWLLAIAGVVVLPWTIRNYRIHHRLVLVQTTSGLSFWKGNNPMASGGNLDPKNRDILSLAPVDFQTRVYSARNEIDQNDLFWKEAFRFIRENPLSFLRLTGKKFLSFWWFSPQAGLWYPEEYLKIYRFYYLGIILLAGMGLLYGYAWLNLLTRQGLSLLLLLSGSVGIAQSFFYVEGRHRWGIESLVLVCAGGGIQWLVKTLLSVRKKSVAL